VPHLPEALAYIGIGGNLGDVPATMRRALQSLQREPLCRICKISPWYRSKAIGPGVQHDHLNAVIELRTQLQATSLLGRLHDIEAAAGRIRDLRWGPRTLDLDLLLYDELVVEDEQLTVPHPRLTERNFVVFPLFDLAPQLRLPDGTRLADIRQTLAPDGLIRLRTPEAFTT
jgi:2-amino-4-hydroxy-6-hydroxymethyldihydropteridine diphosphokinase